MSGKITNFFDFCKKVVKRNGKSRRSRRAPWSCKQGVQAVRGTAVEVTLGLGRWRDGNDGGNC